MYPQQPTQPSQQPSMPYPPMQPQRPGNWFTRLNRGAQVGIGCLTLIVICGFCGAIGSLVSNGNNSTSTTSTSTTVAQATNTPAATVKPTDTPKPKAWHTIHTFTGNGISNTAPFTVTEDQWKITWSCNPAAYGSSYNLIADLTVPGDQLGDTVVNVICTQDDASTRSGESMEYTPGTFYLDVNSEASWTFQIQVYR